MSLLAEARAKKQAKEPPKRSSGLLAEARAIKGVPQQPEIDLDAFNPADFGETPADVVEPQPKPGFFDQVKALGETGLTAGTAATFGTLGGMAGFLEGLAKEIYSGKFGPLADSPAEAMAAAERIAKRSQERAAGNVILPESELGKKRLEQLGELTEPLAALPPAIAEAGAISRGFSAVAPIATGKVAGGVDDVVASFKNKLQDRRKIYGRNLASAAEVDSAQQRRELAKELPVPIDLTEGQATKEFGQQQFERETAKLADVGSPLRDRFDDQNMQLQQNIDSFIDETGATAFDLREVGESVDKALRGKVARDKMRIRKLYKEAEASGGMKDDVDINTIADYLNKNRAEREESGLMVKVQRQLEALEVSGGDFKDGSLSIVDVDLNQAEHLRRFISRNIKSADSNDLRIGSDLKRILDQATEGKGNDKYKAARKARRKLAQDIESTNLLKQLTTLKRGTEERSIALEDILRKSVISKTASRDSLHKLRRVLQNSGEEGQQAWKDIQGGTLQYIQDEMLNTVKQNSRGETVVSFAKMQKAVKNLDSGGKLDLIYGKKGAEQIRLLTEVARDVLTSAEGAVNYSGTAAILATMMDLALTSQTGIPAPIATIGNAVIRNVKDKRLRVKVKQALSLKEDQ